MEELPRNSMAYNKQSEDKKDGPRVEPIFEGEVIRRKTPIRKSLANTFLGTSDTKGVMGYVWFDILVPAAQNMFVDATIGGVERLVRGESYSGRPGSYRPSSYQSSHGVSYNSRYTSPASRGGGRQADARPGLSRQARAMHDFREIIIHDRIKAEEIVEKLYFLTDHFGQARVADLYDLLNITSDHPDTRYGWTNLTNARVTRVSDGFLLDLPQPIYLD